MQTLLQSDPLNGELTQKDMYTIWEYVKKAKVEESFKKNQGSKELYLAIVTLSSFFRSVYVRMAKNKITCVEGAEW